MAGMRLGLVFVAEIKKELPAATSPPLVVGQLWRLKSGYLQITGVGKRLTEYKLLKRLRDRVVRNQMGNHASVEAYLKATQATLVSAEGRARKRKG